MNAMDVHSVRVDVLIPPREAICENVNLVSEARLSFAQVMNVAAQPVDAGRWEFRSDMQNTQVSTPSSNPRKWSGPALKFPMAAVGY